MLCGIRSQVSGTKLYSELRRKPKTGARRVSASRLQAAHTLGARQRPPIAALSGSQHKAPGFAGGYLLDVPHSAHTFEIVASCCDGMKSLQAIQDLCPNIALLDSSMPVVSGIKNLATVSSERYPTRILLTATVEQWGTIAARSIGASGVIPKDVQPEALVRGLRQVAAGARLPVDAFRVARSSNRSSSLSYHAERC